MAFQYLDRLRRSKISASDLVSFMRENRMSVSDVDGYLVLKQFDENKDGYLTFEDFQNMFLPMADQVLRRVVFERNETGASLTKDIIDGMLRILEEEVYCIDRVERAKRELSASTGFNILDLFCKLGSGGPVEIHGLQRFAMNLGLQVSSEELQGVTRRFDRDRDGVISYTEFVDSILPTEPKFATLNSPVKGPARRAPSGVDVSISPVRHMEGSMRSPRSPLRSSSPRPLIREEPLEQTRPDMSPKLEPMEQSFRRPSSPLRSSPRSTLREEPREPIRPNKSPSKLEQESLELSQMSGPSASMMREPLRRSNLEQSINRGTSPLKSGDQVTYKEASQPASPYRETSFLRSEPDTDNQFEPPSQLMGQSINFSPEKAPTDMDVVGQESDVVNMLKEQIHLDRELEMAKQSLSLLPDFNLIDAFRIFDQKDKGVLSVPDIEHALNILGVVRRQDDLLLLLKKFGTADDNLRFVNFQDMFLPKVEEYAKLLNAREKSYFTPEYRMEVFSKTTMDSFKSTLKIHFEVLRAADGLRHRINEKQDFTLRNAFKSVDRNRKGYIGIEEFQSILNEHGIVASDKDLLILMDRYDKDKDGRVSYSEFVQEMTPHSPTKP